MIRQSKQYDQNHCMNQQSILKKTTRKEKRKLLRKLIRIKQEQEKESWIINKLKIHQQSKNRYLQKWLSKERIIFSLWEKETSDQRMQKSTTRKINEDMNTDNYNRKIMWKRMMSKHEMLTASFTTKLSQESIMT